MNLFFTKRQQKPVIPPELQPYYGHSGYGVWKRYVFPALFVLALVGIAVAVWFIVNRNSGNDNKGDNGLKMPTQSQSKSPNYTQSPQHNPVLDKKTGDPAKTDVSNSQNTKPIPVQ